MNYGRLSRRFDVSLLCLLPLAGIYIVCVFMLHAAPPNGADFLTPLLWRLGGRTALLLFALGLLFVALLLLYRLRKVGFKVSLILGVAAEGFIFAGAMIFILYFFVRVYGGMSVSGSAAGIIAVSAGAGLWEELLFRALIFWGLYKLLTNKQSRKLTRVCAFLIALFVSSALFSAVHFFAEPPTWGAFFYRLIAGGFLCGLYGARGLAVCGFSHFFFDILVLAGR